MLIKSLVLTGYKRLLLNNVRVFRYTITSPLQLILGTNGSGKSSVLRELSPLPATPADYISGGSKVIEIEDKNETYILTSSIKSGGSHSFIRCVNGSVVGGEELNPGGTGQVQKELVRQIFGYSQDIHDLLLGNVCFTTMTAAQRRQWITKISDINLDYAMGVYDRGRTAARDASGALKHVRGRLAKETAVLMDFKDVEELEQRSLQLREELNVLLHEREGSLPPPTQCQQRIFDHLATLEQCCTEIVRTDLTRPIGYRFHGHQDVLDTLEQQRTERVVLETNLQRDQLELEELSTLLATLDQGGVGDVSVIRQTLSEKRSLREKKREGIHTFFVDSDPLDVLLSTKEALPTLVEVFRQIPDNTERQYTRERHQQKQRELEGVRKEIDRLTVVEARATGRLEHLAQLQDQECPSCEHRWKPGLSPAEVEHLQGQIRATTEQLETLRVQRDQIDQVLEDIRQYTEIYAQYRQLVSSYPRLRQLWDYILEHQCITDQPSRWIPLFHKWERDLELSIEVVSLDKECDLLQTALEQSERLQGTDAQYSKTRHGELKRMIEAHLTALDQLKLETEAVKRFERALTKVNGLMDKGRHCLHVIEGELAQWTRSERTGMMSGLIQGHQGTLAQVDSRLREHSAVVGIVNDLTQSETALALDEEALKLVVSELSPTDGLIADQLKGFISCLVGQMNDIIAQIWTYELRVLPCGTEEGELDYRFPLLVKTNANVVPDVRLGSTAQSELVDFAFKLVAMLHLGLVQHPLYADELGDGFDEQHRVNLMTYVKMLMDAKRHSQLFMINHHAAQWGVFQGAEICVLDTANVTVPQIHNKHVEIL